MASIEDVPLIVRREIEVRMLAPFYEAFARELGRQRADEIVADVVGDMGLESGRSLAAEKPEEVDALEYYRDTVMPRFSSGGAMAWADVTCEPGYLAADAVGCAYADMYRRIGQEHLGELLSCNRDRSLFEGLDPDIEFTRTETLLMGCSRCDFRLRLHKSGAEGAEG